jgi:putative ABC transport system permease protein
VLRLGRLLGLRQVRRHPLRAVLAVLAVAAGTTMAMSVLVVRTSVTHSVDAFARSLGGPTELRVTGAIRRGGVLPGVVEAVEGTRGVDVAVPMVQALTLADGSFGGSRAALVLGVDCRVEALVGPLGCTDEALAAAGDTPLAVGPGMAGYTSLRTRDGSLAVGDAPVAERLAGMAGGRVVVLSLEAAQRHYRRGYAVDVVYVRPQAGTDPDALAQRLSGVVGEQDEVLRADEGPPEAVAALSAVLPLFTLMAVFACVIGGLLVYNTATLSIEERRTELAVTAALGGTAPVVAAAALAEAASVGAAGGLLGAAGGAVVAGPIVANLSVFSERVAGVPLAVHMPPSAVAASVALGVVVSLAATALPVRRALRVDVAAELSGRSRLAEASAPAGGRRAAAWLAVTAVGAALIVVGTRTGGVERWQPPVAAAGFALLVLGLLVFGGVLAVLVLGVLDRVAGRTATGRLAVANLAREPRRTGVMVVAVSAVATTAFVTVGYARGVQAAIETSVVHNLHGIELGTTASGVAGDFDVTPSPALLLTLDAVEGVAKVHESPRVLVGTRPDELTAVAAFDDPWLADPAVLGRLDRTAFEAGGAIVNVGLARAEGLRPGDDVALPTPSGIVRVPVIAVVEAGGAAPRAVQIPIDLLRRLYGDQPSSTLTVEADPGVSPEELQLRVQEAVATSDIPDTGVWTSTPDQVVADSIREAERELAPFWVLQRTLIAVSFVSVLSTLLLAGVQRRREMAMLGAVGMEPAALGRMVLAEAGLVAVVAAWGSIIGGAVILWGIVRVGPLLIGWRTPLRFDWGVLVTWGLASAVVTLGAALWPARRAARTEVAAALQPE